MGFSTISYPGAASTRARAIDGNNVVGDYTDIPIPPALPHLHGFLFDGTTYSTIDKPGAADTYLIGIAGDYIFGIGDGSRFLYRISTTAFTALSFPSVAETVCYGVNSSGKVVGEYKDNIGNGWYGALNFKLHGVLFDGSAYSTVDVPGALHTTCTAIDSAGNICGFYIDARYFQRAFFRDAAGNFTTLAPPGCCVVCPYGISGGSVAGLFTNGDAGLGNSGTPNQQPAATSGFIWSSGAGYTKLDYPGADANMTYALGISGSTVVGLYVSGGAGHVFKYVGGLSPTYTNIDPPSGARAVMGVSGTKIVGLDWLYQ